MEGVVYLTVYHGNKMPPFYIGSTFAYRFYTGYRGSVTSRLYKDVWKYELKNNPHLFKTLAIVFTNDRETAQIKEYALQLAVDAPNNPLYINKGFACKKFAQGVKKSDKTKKLMSLAKRGKTPSTEARANMSKSALKRTPMSDITKLKLSIKSRNLSDETRQKLSYASKNSTIETRNKISKSNTGKKHSDETKNKIAIANKSPAIETRRKRSIAVAKNLQKFVFLVTDKFGHQSCWGRLQDFFDAGYGSNPTSMMRTLRSGKPISFGENRGCQLLERLPRINLPTSYFLELSCERKANNNLSDK